MKKDTVIAILLINFMAFLVLLVKPKLRSWGDKKKIKSPHTTSEVR